MLEERDGSISFLESSYLILQAWRNQECRYWLYLNTVAMSGSRTPATRLSKVLSVRHAQFKRVSDLQYWETSTLVPTVFIPLDQRLGKPACAVTNLHKLRVTEYLWGTRQNTQSKLVSTETYKTNSTFHSKWSWQCQKFRTLRLNMEAREQGDEF